MKRKQRTKMSKHPNASASAPLNARLCITFSSFAKLPPVSISAFERKNASTAFLSCLSTVFACGSLLVVREEGALGDVGGVGNGAFVSFPDFERFVPAFVASTSPSNSAVRAKHSG